MYLSTNSCLPIVERRSYIDTPIYRWLRLASSISPAPEREGLVNCSDMGYTIYTDLAITRSFVRASLLSICDGGRLPDAATSPNFRRAALAVRTAFHSTDAVT